MVFRTPQKMSAMVPARIIDRRSTTRPFSTNTIARAHAWSERAFACPAPSPLPLAALSLCPRPCSFSLACFFVFFLVTEAEGARVGEAR